MPVLKIKKADGTWQEVWGAVTDTPVGGMVEQVQADWNQNNSTKPDFIKNKPFGERDVMTNLLQTTQYDEFFLDPDLQVILQTPEATYSLVIGETYKVFWDNVEYICVAQDGSLVFPGAVALGNASAFGLSGNNEPFIIATPVNSFTCYVALTDTEPGGSHTVSVVQEHTVVDKIDPKYLPDNIGGGSALPEVTTSDAGKFLRVGSDGEWIVEAIQNAEEVSF